MTVMGLDHVNIRVKDPEATADFLIKVLGMGRSPVRDSWIVDASGRAVVHLGTADATYPADSWRPFTPRDNSGAVHHVALACSGYDAVVERLETLGIDHRRDEFQKMGLRQILVMVPGEVMFELNFTGD